MRSIRRQLLVWLLALVLLGVGIAGWLIYRQALAEANELFDYQLEQIAAALPSEPFSQVLGSRDNGDEGIVLQIWNRNGVLMYYSRPRAPLAPRAELGFSTEHTERGEWRVYGAIVGDNVVQLAQPVSVRNRLAANVALRTLWPLIVLLPLMGMAVWVIVGRGLRPLRRVTSALDARHPEALDPLPDQRLPLEVQPLVRALNGLLATARDRAGYPEGVRRRCRARTAHAARRRADSGATGGAREGRRCPQRSAGRSAGRRHARHAACRAIAGARALRTGRTGRHQRDRSARAAAGMRGGLRAACAESRRRSRHRGERRRHRDRRRRRAARDVQQSRR